MNPSPSDYFIELIDPVWFWQKPRWRLVSALNGQILAPSETYSSAAARDQTASRLSAATGIPMRRQSNDD